MRKLIIIAAALVVLAVPATGMAAPHSAVNQNGSAMHNTNANENACWGQDRSFYASGEAREDLGWDNMDIKQSFPTDVGNERAAWVANYC